MSERELILSEEREKKKRGPEKEKKKLVMSEERKKPVMSEKRNVDNVRDKI
jgi:hypothetical protein